MRETWFVYNLILLQLSELDDRFWSLLCRQKIDPLRLLFLPPRVADRDGSRCWEIGNGCLPIKYICLPKEIVFKGDSHCLCFPGKDVVHSGQKMAEEALFPVK